ncbi:hypothetical protein [Segatella copri]|nr:hypothetical protein [Segatella copri]
MEKGIHKSLRQRLGSPDSLRNFQGNRKSTLKLILIVIMNKNKAKIETDKKGAVPSSCIEITDFDRGMWCVIQIILTTQKDYSLTAELCRNVGFGFNKIKALQEDCGQSFEEEVNDFLKDCSNGGTDLNLPEE